jgi:hypothetical protein
MHHHSVILDPKFLDETIDRLALTYELDSRTLTIIQRIIGLYTRPVTMYVDPANAMLYKNLAMADKFTFDIETDELVLFSQDPETFIDALIEMAMYQAGFSTMMGNDEEWVIEFTVGAWKPVKNRIKRQLGIEVHEKPRGVIGLPPAPENAPHNDPYPFRTLVSSYDLASFYQMVVLAARDDIAVYFPPEAHPKVLAVYVYMRRAMQEIAQGLDLSDYPTFNTRLLEAIARLQNLFDPASLPPPGWARQQPARFDSQASLFPNDAGHPAPSKDPFAAFIEQLFADDDPEDDD